eukprot:5614548-Pleurochrysis_carterae.AAC.2
MRLDGEMDLLALSKRCSGFVGADLAALCKEAAVVAVNRIFGAMLAPAEARAASERARERIHVRAGADVNAAEALEACCGHGLGESVCDAQRAGAQLSAGTIDVATCVVDASEDVEAATAACSAQLSNDAALKVLPTEAVASSVAASLGADSAAASRVGQSSQGSVVAEASCAVVGPRESTAHLSQTEAARHALAEGQAASAALRRQGGRLSAAELAPLAIRMSDFEARAPLSARTLSRAREWLRATPSNACAQHGTVPDRCHPFLKPTPSRLAGTCKRLLQRLNAAGVFKSSRMRSCAHSFEPCPLPAVLRSTSWSLKRATTTRRPISRRGDACAHRSVRTRSASQPLTQRAPLPRARLQAGLKKVQPSAKREGFATVPDVTWAGAHASACGGRAGSVFLCGAPVEPRLDWGEGGCHSLSPQLLERSLEGPSREVGTTSITLLSTLYVSLLFTLLDVSTRSAKPHAFALRESARLTSAPPCSHFIALDRSHYTATTKCGLTVNASRRANFRAMSQTVRVDHPRVPVST